MAVDSEDLAVLELDARRRGVPLTHLLSAALAESADRLRADRLRQDVQPRFGLAGSGSGAACVAAADEHAPARAHGDT